MSDTHDVDNTPEGFAGEHPDDPEVPEQPPPEEEP